MRPLKIPKVLNKRTDKIPPGAIYVGRPSKWGNPYKVGGWIKQQTAVDLYRNYIRGNLDLIVDLQELKGKDLVCWCAPLPCHADILLELANKDMNEVSLTR